MMKLKHQSEYSENINQSDIILQCPENNCWAHMVNKVYDNYNKVSYPQRNKKYHNLEATFQKNVNVSQ